MLPQGLLQDLELFRGVSTEDILALTAGAELEVHRHKDLVFTAGMPAEHFGIVLQGCYKMSRPGPPTTLMAFALRGAPVGLLLMPDPNSVYPVTVQALGLGQFLKLPRSAYLECWLKAPEIMRRSQAAVLHRCLGFHADRGRQHLSLEKRIAGFLLRCLDLYAEEGTRRIPFPLSRREVSDGVGAQVESVIRVMSQWEKEGTISTRAQCIEIARPENLVRLQNGSGEVGFVGE